MVAVEPGIGDGWCGGAGGRVVGELPEGTLPLAGVAPGITLPLPRPTALALGVAGGSNSTSSLGIPAT